MSDRDIGDYLYQRGDRWYADFRSFSDVGGSRESLVPDTARHATKDRETAEEIAEERLDELQERRAADGEVPREAVRLRAFAPRYLQLKARETDIKKGSLTRERRALEHAMAGLVDEDGEAWDPYLHEVDTGDIKRLRRHLLNVHISEHTGENLKPRSVRYATDALSRLYGWAHGEGYVPRGYDPVAGLNKRLSPEGESVAPLEPHEAAALLHCLVEQASGLHPHVGLNWLLALTGARKKAGAGLLTREVDRSQAVVRYQSNRCRDIKTGRGGHRAVPVWPQLELLLQAYLAEHDRGDSELLFPAVSMDGNETPITDFRKRLRNARRGAAELLDELDTPHRLWDWEGRARPAAAFVDEEDLHPAVRDGTVEEVLDHPARKLDWSGRSHRKPAYRRARSTLRDALDEKRAGGDVWRTTYASARVQTLDGGHPVAERTVAAELGHSSENLLQRVYAEVGNNRVRLPWVEYRLPDGRLPGERYFRETLGCRQVEEILARQRALVTRAPSQNAEYWRHKRGDIIRKSVSGWDERE